MNNSIEELYKKASSESTPVALDNFILNAAKQSCEDKSKSQPRGWLYALSTAAVLVMGVTVVFNLQDQNSNIETITKNVLESPSLKQNKVQAQVASTPPLEPHPRPQKKRKVAAKNSRPTGTNLGEIIANKATTQIEIDATFEKESNNEDTTLNETTHIAGTIEKAEKAYDAKLNNDFTAKELTKSRVEYKNNNTIPSSEIDKLKTMISEKKLQQATTLLVLLQQKYPNYDFTEIDNLIDSIKTSD